MAELSFWVPGIPQPQGSTRAFKRGAKIITTSDNVKLRPWRDVVAWHTRAELLGHPGIELFQGHPVDLDLVFWFARPAGHFGKRGLFASAPPSHTVRPDLDKLVRAVQDAIAEAQAFRNDSQVVHVWAMKCYCTSSHSQPGVDIKIRFQTVPLMAQPAATPEVTHHRQEGQVQTSRSS